jgi:hypothetical protein
MISNAHNVWDAFCDTTLYTVTVNSSSSIYRVIKKLCMSKPEGRRSVGRPKMRWLDDVEEKLRKIRISGWRGKARRRDERKSVLREAKVLQGL